MSQSLEQIMLKLAAEQSAKVRAMWPERMLLADQKIIDKILAKVTK